ncbi:Threonine dehydratase [uncultured delta proteobacterium]|uniref:threonine ammonia-lyase n=1 Tax=uncultured delta proteobacterium TaxID=34034 RepID=A0A212KEZ9_9DELT|nr:Threonine dehydratase [uncultured delta proteobacterium]
MSVAENRKGTVTMAFIDTIEDARAALEGVIERTAMIPAHGLCQAKQVLLKAENLQKTGSFKIRGAYYRISRLSDEEKARGVIACSAGNHAQGVALSAKREGIKCVICMPEGAPISKVEKTRAHGAEVVLCPGVYDDAYTRALELQKEHGYTFIHPFDNLDVIAGQGTIGLEIVEQAPDTDIVFVPVGGGGIIGGIACAIKNRNPRCKVYGVEPVGAASMRESIEAGRILTLPSLATMADGIAVKRPGEETFALCQQYVDGFVCVSESEIASAMLTLMEDYKVVAEGAGAVSVAAAMYGKVDVRGKNVCCVVSGGNVDVNVVALIINKGLKKTGRVMEFETVLDDKPRQLKKLLGILADEGANILAVQHERESGDMDVGKCVVGLKLETRGREHIDQITHALQSQGYKVYCQNKKYE